MSLSPVAQTHRFPPGVAEWPQPGEAYVSPQLAKELTGKHSRNFGTIAGIIDRSALASPTERHVYLRPLTPHVFPDLHDGVSHFGVFDDSAPVSSGHLYRSPLSMSASLIVLAVIAPGCLTVIAGAATGKNELRSTAWVLTAIGASRWRLCQFDLVEVAPSLLSSLIIAGSLTTVATRIDIAIPFLDALYPANDTRSIAPLLAICVALGILVAAMLITGTRACLRWARPHTSIRMRDHDVAGALFILCLTAAVVVPHYMGPSPWRGVFVSACGFLAAALGWAPVSMACRAAGRLVLSWSRHGRFPALLVAGRALSSPRLQVAPLSAGIMAITVLVGLLQFHTSAMTASMREATTAPNRYGKSIMEVREPVTPVPDDELRSILSPQVLIVRQDDSGAIPRLTGTCEAFTALYLPCPEEHETATATVTDERAQYVTLTPGQVIVARGADVPDQSDAAKSAGPAVLFSFDNSDIDTDQLQAELTQRWPGAIVQIRSSWAVAAHVTMIQTYWAMLMAAIGAVGLLTALIVTIALSASNHVRIVAPLTATCGTHTFVTRAVTVSLAVPVLLSGTLSLATYHLLPLGMEQVINDPATPSWQTTPELSWGIVIATCMTVVGSTITARIMTSRQCRSWRPGKRQTRVLRRRRRGLPRHGRPRPRDGSLSHSSPGSRRRQAQDGALHQIRNSLSQSPCVMKEGC